MTEKVSAHSFLFYTCHDFPQAFFFIIELLCFVQSSAEKVPLYVSVGEVLNSAHPHGRIQILCARSDLAVLPPPSAARKFTECQMKSKSTYALSNEHGGKERHSKLHLTALDNSACSHQMHID